MVDEFGLETWIVNATSLSIVHGDKVRNLLSMVNQMVDPLGRPIYQMVPTRNLLLWMKFRLQDPKLEPCPDIDFFNQCVEQIESRLLNHCHALGNFAEPSEFLRDFMVVNLGHLVTLKSDSSTWKFEGYELMGIMCFLKLRGSHDKTIAWIMSDSCPLVFHHASYLVENGTPTAGFPPS